MDDCIEMGGIPLVGRLDDVVAVLYHEGLRATLSPM
jgi:hypothetical protein